MLAGRIADAKEAASWYSRCQQEFKHSTYFEGAARLQLQQYDLTGSPEALGKLTF